MSEFVDKILIQKIQKRIELDLLSGCWIWIGHKNNRGYGCFEIKQKEYKAYRLTYEYWNGKIPEGLEIDHLCRNTSCVNPSHLEAVTHKENVVRGLTGKINHWSANKTHCKKGHEFNKENTYIRPDGWRACKICKKKAKLRFNKNSNSICR